MIIFKYLSTNASLKAVAAVVIEDITRVLMLRKLGCETCKKITFLAMNVINAILLERGCYIYLSYIKIP